MSPDLRIGEGMLNVGSGTAGEETITGLTQGAAPKRQDNPAADDMLQRPRLAAGIAEQIDADERSDLTLSDAELAKSATTAIRRTVLLTAGKVRLAVRNGWLTLEGEVDGPAQKHAAEDAVRGLSGLRGVTSNILIESEVMAQRVSQKIDETFVRSARISANRILVTVHDHQIILSGSVRSVEERADAETAAWGVPGVAQVVNRIRANV